MTTRKMQVQSSYEVQPPYRTNTSTLLHITNIIDKLVFQSKADHPRMYVFTYAHMTFLFP